MKELLERWRQWWREGRASWKASAEVGDSFGDAPTSEEMAQRCALLEAQRSDLIRRLDERAATIRELQVALDQGGDAARVSALLQFVERCGEASHAALKVQARGGWECTRNGKGMPRWMVLERAVGELLASLEPLYVAGQVRAKQVHLWKRQRLGPALAGAVQEKETGQ